MNDADKNQSPFEQKQTINTGGGDFVGREKYIQQILPPTPIQSLRQIPTPPSDFTGRDQELSELLRAIQHGGVHISCLQGTGGVGKTALLGLALPEARRICQVLINLLTNGLRHTFAGGEIVITGQAAVGEIYLALKENG